MSIPIGPQTGSPDCCDRASGTYPPPDIAPYVVSIFGLQGIVGMQGNGALDITTVGNDIIFSFSASAGLGSVTSVGLSSTSLTVTNSPITTLGTMTVDLTGATASIQNLVTAADKMIYTTGSDVYATTDLTAFARTLLDDAAAVNARSTLGLVIGTNVQAWSADLDSVVSNTVWAGANVTFSGSVTATSFVGAVSTGGNDVNLGGGSILNGDAGTFSGDLTAGNLIGAGAAITALDAANISAGTLAVARGGTNIGSYTIGDILYASGATTLAKLADVSQGCFLRSGGVGVAPAWSAISLPNSLAIGDILYASTTGAISRLADVATGNALISGGVATAPSWGKITSSHTTGLAASGVNGDITQLTALTSVTSGVVFTGTISVEDILYDTSAFEGDNGMVLTSTTTGVLWSDQLNISTLNISGYLTLEGTITAGGTTGAQTINKPAGSVNFAAAASSLVVTNNLCTASSIVIAIVASNDTTMKTVAAVPGAGFFTLYSNAAANAETSVRWLLINPT